MLARSLVTLGIVCFAAACLAGELAVDDSPGGPGEWGFRPTEGEASDVNPPGFVWRPQKGAASYEFEVSRDAAFAQPGYRAEGLHYNAHCLPKPLERGPWHWRFRYKNGRGEPSAWSQVRAFTVAENAVEFPMPPREELLSRIPQAHPRLFVRPEQLAALRERARGDLKEPYSRLVAECERLLRNPPPTTEPPKYPPGMETKSEEWRAIWWGNRVYTINALNGAATLAFTRLLGGRDEYGQLAKRLLLAAAEWDPKGSTGYRYNDEAGMPYSYCFARTYTFLNDLLSDEERARCRRVMAIRGQEMYDNLAAKHLWRPYDSHANRAWHKLGEVGIAFLGEIPDAAEWVWFALHVFFNAYPVWCDADGGWHEGSSYWASYISRFTWWADVMRVAMGIDAYRKPYFSQIGYYPLYLQPPGTTGGGFGDLAADRPSKSAVPVMTTFASQARNPYWQWYVDVQGGPQEEKGYIGFIRGALPRVEPKPPADLPVSRCFRGTGQAVLNTTLLDAKDNVEVVFKSSPFGTQSHGYDAQNAFLLYAFGERLLVSTGRRDIHGSAHHTQWMWETKSTNSVTVNGQGQDKHSSASVGEITAFHTSAAFDFVAGEAARAYGDRLKRFTRRILFIKPEAIVIWDRLEAPKPSTFEWWLHAPTRMEVNGQSDIRVANGKAACRVAFLEPAGLKLALTDQFDPPPRARIKLTEWHLSAATPEPALDADFITTIRVHRADAAAPPQVRHTRADDGFTLETPVADGTAIVTLHGDTIKAVRHGRNGALIHQLTIEGGHVK
ncbi:MAG TPA: DUF4962 domain-containing protein [Planctomycetota bacterium]|nr:DUF4962 domain-containing protein [Planctomycetota bacterium]HRR80443.1 DUF4962 domain-containing protein [Planctomycetota bacterium]HRT96625.1 DUF4962 domain-containing protein [Planctomycetota bacterium]